MGCTIIIDAKLDDKSSADSGLPTPDASGLDDYDAGSAGGSDHDAAPDTAKDASSEVDATVVDMPGPNSGAQLSMGVRHACGLDPSGHLACWGSNADGQIDLATNKTYSAISAGYYHSCGITMAGELLCAGRNDAGQRKNLPGPFTHVAAGDLHTCALDTAGKAQCFGDNTFGQCDAPNEAFIAIAGGSGFTCAIRSTDQTLRCWGREASKYESATKGVKLKRISAQVQTVCGVKSDDAADCWGAYKFFQPPNGALSIEASDELACSLTIAGTVLCGSVDESYMVPEEFLAGHYVAIAVSSLYTAADGAVCGIPAAGKAVCFAVNDTRITAVPASFLK